MSATDTTPSTETSSHASSGPHPDGFVLSHLSRDFFQAYYQHQHGRSLSDQEILTLVNRAHNQAIANNHPYRCIREYQFCYPRVMTHPRYAQLVQHNALASQVRLLDVGSCMGTDLRQMILHGVRPENALGLELERDFIDLGLDVLYQDRALLQDSFTTQDVLADDYLTANQKLSSFHADGIDLIYVGSVYHLLDEAATHTLTKHLYSLLKPGAVLFGRTVGSLDPVHPVRADWSGLLRFLHSDDSFKRMLLQYGFVDVEFVKVEADTGSNNPSKVDARDQDGHHMERRGAGMFAFYARKAHT